MFARRALPLLVVATASLLLPGCGCQGGDPTPDGAAPVEGTRTVVGVVVDPAEQPVAGARVEAGDAFVQTGADGRFLLQVPPSTAPSVSVHAEGFARAERLLDVRGDWASAGTLMLTRLTASGRVEPSGGTLGGAGAGVTVTVPPGAFSRALTVEAALIPLGDVLLDDLRLPLPIPSAPGGAIAPLFALVLEAEGEQPSRPIELRLDSTAGLPAGAAVPVGRYDGVTGAWVDVGVAVAAADGSLVFSVGHLSVFAGALPAVPADDARPPELDGLTRVPTPFPRGEPRVDARSGALQLGVELPGLVRRGQKVSLTLFHDSRTPAPRVTAPVALPTAKAGESVVVEARTAFASERVQVSVSASAAAATPPVVVTDLAPDAQRPEPQVLAPGTYPVIEQVLRADDGALHASRSASFSRPTLGARLARGGAPVPAPAKVFLRNVEVRPAAVDNRAQSPFGAGWHLAGLTRLVQPWCQSGEATLAGGFETPAIAFAPSGELYLARVEQRLVEAGLDLSVALWEPALLALSGDTLFVGLRMNGRAEVWRLRGEAPAERVAGGGAPGTASCAGPAADLFMERLTGLAGAPAGDGVLFATEACVVHVKSDGTSTLLAGDKGFSAPQPATGQRVDAVDFRGELLRVDFGRAPGVWLFQDYLLGNFLARDGTLEFIRTRVSHPHGVTAAIDAAGALFYTAPGSRCLYRWEDGLNDEEVFPSCLGAVPTALEDGPAETARVGQIDAMTFDDTGTLWFFDSTFQALRKLGADGIVTTVSGGAPGALEGVGGPVSEATLGPVYELAAGANGALAIAGLRTLLQLQRPAGDALRGLGAADGSTLTRRPDGTWRRLLADGTQELYDARGLLQRRWQDGEPGLGFAYAAWPVALEEERCGAPTPPPTLEAITLADERLFTFTWSAGRLQAITDIAGRATTLAWEGALVSTIRPPGGELSFGYDEGGRVLERRSPGPAGAPVTWRYGYQDGRIASVQVPGRGTLTYESAESSAKVPTSARSAAGVTRGISAGPAISTVPVGQGGRATLALGTRTLVVTDAAGQGTVLEMDTAGRLVGEVRADGTTLRLVRDVVGRIVELVNVTADERWRYVYDAAGRLTQRADPAGRLTHSSYDGDGRLATRQEPDGARLSFRYETSGAAEGLPNSVTDALGRETKLAYDGQGNTVQYTGPGGEVTNVERDAVGRAVKVTEPSGVVHTTTFDARDGIEAQRLGAPDAGEAVAYRRVLADGWEAEGSHVPASAMLEATDGAGRPWRFGRDDAFQLTRLETPGEGVVTQLFDAQGRRSRRAAEDGSAEVFEWSAEGRLQRRFFEGPAAGADLRLEYDALGRVARLVDPLLTETRTMAPGVGWTRVTLAPDPALGETARFSLDRSRRSPSLTTQALGATRYLLHADADGQLSRVELEQTAVGNSAREVLRFTYDASRALQTVTRGNGTVTRRFFDAAGRVERQEEQTPTATTTLTWTYDAAGRPATRSAGGVTRTYAYDAQGRLAACSDTGEQFTWGRTGARESAGGVLWMRDARGRLGSDGQSDFTFDALGRRTSRTSRTDPSDRLALTWGRGGLLSEVRRGPAGASTLVASFLYDGSGRRVRRDTAAGSWFYGYLPDTDRPVRVVEPSGAAWHLVHATKAAAFTLAVTAAGAERYVHLDPFGAIVGVSNEAGALTLREEDCFGQPRPAPPGTGPQLGFHGLIWDDESGLYSAGARYYDPATGEFLSPDPAGLEAGADPWGYAGGNPVLRADPSGRFFFVIAGALLAGAVIANEIRSFAQSKEVASARRSYEDMTNLDDDDGLASAEQAHGRLHKAADKGGDTAIKCVKKGIESVTNPVTDTKGLRDQVIDLTKDALQAAGAAEGDDDET